ncbi:hypothetical protein BD770DRAFT_406072 [Pilaira anomala]|nr:hypothetical protein BD770DRAFT_406072 [Pilaira anomala]
MSELFLHEDELNLSSYSEADFFHDVWPFVYRISEEKGVIKMLGERFSVAVASARNADRSLEVTERRQRKIPGSWLDVPFKIRIQLKCRIFNDGIKRGINYNGYPHWS